RKALIESFRPAADRRVQPWPKELLGFDSSLEDSYDYDPAKARRLLRESGHPNGVDAGEMLVAAYANLPRVGEVLQAQLAKVGIKVELRTVDVFSLVSKWPQSKDGIELMVFSLQSIDPYAWAERL